MSEDNNNVIEGYFARACIKDMLNDMRDVVDKYAERISVVEAIGIIEILKMELYDNVIEGD